MERSSIYLLPPELLILIFGHLDTYTLQTVASLNPYFNDIINNDHIWKVIFIKRLVSGENAIDVNILPGKRKLAKHHLSINDQNVVEKNNRIITAFPSMSNSYYWKTEFLVRFTYLKKILNINKNKKINNAKLQKKDFTKLNPYLLTSVYKVHSNYLIDDIVTDFYNDKLILFSKRTHNLNFLSLKQGKKNYQVDSHISHTLLLEHSATQQNIITAQKLCKNFIMLGNTNGLIFFKQFNNDFAFANSLSEKFFGRHTIIDQESFHLQPQLAQMLITRKLFISSIALHPMFDANVNQFSKTSLDLISGDLNGQVFGWNYITKQPLFQLNINQHLNIQEFNSFDPNLQFPVLKIQSNFKSTIVIESINMNLFVIQLKSDLDYSKANYTVKHVSIPVDHPDETTTLHAKLFNNSEDHLATDMFTQYLIDLVTSKLILTRTFLDVDYASEKIIFSQKNKIEVLSFDGYKRTTVNTLLPSEIDEQKNQQQPLYLTQQDQDPNLRIERVIQTKIINNHDAASRKLNGSFHAGNNSPLHIALFSSGKVVIHSTTRHNSNDTHQNNSSNNPLVFKVIPAFIQEIFDTYPNAANQIYPLNRFDCNNSVLLLTSYNGWMAIVNILNGTILKIIENKIPKTLVNSPIYNRIIEHRYEIENAAGEPQVVSTSVSLSLAPTTAIKLAEVAPMQHSNQNKDSNSKQFKNIDTILDSDDDAEQSAREDKKNNEQNSNAYFLPAVLLNGVVVLNNIVQYFQISFENSLFLKNTAGLTEEALLASKQLKKKNLKQLANLELARNIQAEMTEFEYDNYQHSLKEKILDKYNGATDLNDDEELMLALALSQSLNESATNLAGDVVDVENAGELHEENGDDDEELRKALELSRIDADTHQERLQSLEEGIYQEEEQLRKVIELSKQTVHPTDANLNSDSNEEEDDEVRIRKALQVNNASSSSNVAHSFENIGDFGHKSFEEQSDEDDGSEKDRGKGKELISQTNQNQQNLDEDLRLAIELSKAENNRAPVKYTDHYSANGINNEGSGSSSSTSLPKSHDNNSYNLNEQNMSSNQTPQSSINLSSPAAASGSGILSTTGISQNPWTRKSNKSDFNKNSKNKIKQKYRKLQLSEFGNDAGNDGNDDMDEELKQILELSKYEAKNSKTNNNSNHNNSSSKEKQSLLVGQGDDDMDEELQRILELSKVEQ